jgi:hypothetical protein
MNNNSESIEEKKREYILYIRSKSEEINEFRKEFNKTVDIELNELTYCDNELLKQNEKYEECNKYFGNSLVPKIISQELTNSFNKIKERSKGIKERFNKLKEKAIQFYMKINEEYGNDKLDILYKNECFINEYIGNNEIYEFIYNFILSM